MDNYLILEFTALEQAQRALAAINQIAVAWWAGQGYTVDNGTLVGKNAANGTDEPSKQRTMTWDEVRESPDGTFYFSSPSNDTRFADWRNDLPDGLDTATEKAVPPTWTPSGEEI
ncbi:MAG TPA: hypothetical protein PKI93_08350 [Alphaproteobacteria bacterium]|nr:hypothetical protein [Alphaproteobacteria bacterium]HNS45165.1 hypothetical protein [Alphaproteobacteria bacterium]